MEAGNFATVRFFLAWCLLAITAIALIGCQGARAALEAGNATDPRRCRGGECLIAYQQPEVELMAVLDPEHALGSMLDSIKPGDGTKGSKKQTDPAGCGRPVKPGQRYTPCPPPPNHKPRINPYPRKPR